MESRALISESDLWILFPEDPSLFSGRASMIGDAVSFSTHSFPKTGKSAFFGKPILKIHAKSVQNSQNFSKIGFGGLFRMEKSGKMKGE